MPQKKNAKKALRQSEKKHEQNRIVKAALKTTIKKTKQAIAASSIDEAKLRQTMTDIDKAAQKKLIKKNTAARRKSRLMKQFNQSKKAK